MAKKILKTDKMAANTKSLGSKLTPLGTLKVKYIQIGRNCYINIRIRFNSYATDSDRGATLHSPNVRASALALVGRVPSVPKFPFFRQFRRTKISYYI